MAVTCAAFFCKTNHREKFGNEWVSISVKLKPEDAAVKLYFCTEECLKLHPKAYKAFQEKGFEGER